ncbi:15773_t:CDS:1, partial [Funneliformis geosporum]
NNNGQEKDKKPKPSNNSTKNSSRSNQQQPKNTNIIPPVESWIDDIPHNLEREYYFDQMSCLTPGSNIKNGTNAG